MKIKVNDINLKIIIRKPLVDNISYMKMNEN
jgi:hypothetical protein